MLSVIIQTAFKKARKQSHFVYDFKNMEFSGALVNNGPPRGLYPQLQQYFFWTELRSKKYYCTLMASAAGIIRRVMTNHERELTLNI